MLRPSSSGAAILLAFLALTGPARAGLVLSIANLAGPTGGTGTFEVRLSNTESPGGLDFEVTGFSFALSVPAGSGVEFTSADTATPSAPYLFDGTGIGSIDPSFTLSPDPFPNTSFGALDVEVVFASIAVHPGNVFGLGFIAYSVAPDAPGGAVLISFDDAGTSLSGPSGNPIDLTTDARDGVIRIASVPEPNLLILATSACSTLLLWRSYRRIWRPPAHRPRVRACKGRKIGSEPSRGSNPFEPSGRI